MSGLEAMLEQLTAEHAELTQKLGLIDQQYRVERPTIVSQIGQLAKALSASESTPKSVRGIRAVICSFATSAPIALHGDVKSSLNTSTQEFRTRKIRAQS